MRNLDRLVYGPAVAVMFCSTGVGFEEPDGVLQRFLSRTRTELATLPDFVCTQETQRSRRAGPDQNWTKVDTLRFEVAAVGDQELYARPGERRFQSRPLAEWIGRGTVGTGQFANFAKQVFGNPAVKFEFHGEREQDGSRSLEFSFDVPSGMSGYVLRSGTAEAVVPFQGTFWIAAGTLDLLRLEVQAYDIPEKLGVAQADTAVDYARTVIDGHSVLLPVGAALTVIASDGMEDRNRTRLNSCRHYRTESAVRFEGESTGGEADRVASVRTPEPATPAPALPESTVVEVALENAFNPAGASLGDTLTARVANPVKSGEIIVVPRGAKVVARLVRLAQQSNPFALYEIGLELSELEVDGKRVPISATMLEAGPAAGLIRQSKRLEPTFTRGHSPRMNILVREFQRGQGILNWEAKRGALPAGLKMKWRIDRPGPEPQN